MKCEKTIESNCDLLFWFELHDLYYYLPVCLDYFIVLYCYVCKAFPRKRMISNRVTRPNIDAITDDGQRYRCTYGICQAIYVYIVHSFFIICCRPTWQSIVEFCPVKCRHLMSCYAPTQTQHTCTNVCSLLRWVTGNFVSYFILLPFFTHSLTRSFVRSQSRLFAVSFRRPTLQLFLSLPFAYIFFFLTFYTRTEYR